MGLIVPLTKTLDTVHTLSLNLFCLFTQEIVNESSQKNSSELKAILYPLLPLLYSSLSVKELSSIVNDMYISEHLSKGRVAKNIKLLQGPG